MRKTLTLAVCALIYAGAASAQTNPQAPFSAAKSAAPLTIDARQANQEKRIEQGLQSGRLTQAEAARLQKGEAQIDNAQMRAKEDGKVTLKERHRLDQMADRESHAIRRQKHDRQHDRNHDGQPGHRPASHQKS